MVNVTFTCMTKKEKFDVVDPEVVVLKNGRFAYKSRCPWEGKDNQTLHAFKFCGRADHEAYIARTADPAIEEEDPAEIEPEAEPAETQPEAAAPEEA
jgi:hypothetical protein